jgi:DNA-3-methyladenine glycosylase II
LNAEGIAGLKEPQLRSVGLSRQKASYLLDLAEKCLDGTVRLGGIGRLDDEAVIDMLTQVKGIGRWTAEMFLIFSLGRLDVLPVDDLGVRAAIKDLYGLDDLPDKKTCTEIAAPWRPFATIGSWYCWRSLDLKRNVRQVAKGYPT